MFIVIIIMIIGKGHRDENNNNNNDLKNGSPNSQSKHLLYKIQLQVTWAQFTMKEDQSQWMWV